MTEMVWDRLAGCDRARQGVTGVGTLRVAGEEEVAVALDAVDDGVVLEQHARPVVALVPETEGIHRIMC